MCYLKNLPSQQTFNFDDIFTKEQETTFEQPTNQPNILIPSPYRHIQPQQHNEHLMLTNLISLIEKNNSFIRNMHQSLCKPSKIFTKNTIQTVKQTKELVEDENFTKREQSVSNYQESQDLSQKLFGNHKYKYFLQLAEEFPNVVYKERNFNIAIKLVDSSHKVVRNCTHLLISGNIINLCCAFSTSDASWIHQNRAGEPFLKGKTEVELYKGEASFMKLYARDVSRIYPDGKVNLVIYTKPSTLKYASNNSLEVIAESEEVKPLIINDLMIKAKRKQ